jgi:cephalosporin-C deacetylase-like acetyl esterase
VQDLWKVTLQEVKSKGIAEKDFTEYWLNKRKEIKE